jgi:hypothetical protein
VTNDEQITKIEAAQGNERENAPLLAGRISQPLEAGSYDTRSTARSKIALNCWLPSCLRLKRKLYSSR